MKHTDFVKATNFPCGAQNKGSKSFVDEKTVAALKKAPTQKTSQPTR